MREVRRCSEIERSLRYLETEVVEGGAKDHISSLDTSRTDVTPMRDIYVLEVQSTLPIYIHSILNTIFVDQSIRN